MEAGPCAIRSRSLPAKFARGREIPECELLRVQPHRPAERWKEPFERRGTGHRYRALQGSWRLRFGGEPVADAADELFPAIGVALDVLARDVGNELLITVPPSIAQHQECVLFQWAAPITPTTEIEPELKGHVEPWQPLGVQLGSGDIVNPILTVRDDVHHLLKPDLPRIAGFESTSRLEACRVGQRKRRLRKEVCTGRRRDSCESRSVLTRFGFGHCRLEDPVRGPATGRPS